MLTIDLFEKFWEENREKINYLYKCSLLSWNYFDNEPGIQGKRSFPSIKFHLIHDINFIFVVEAYNYNDVMSGFPIAFIDNDIVKKIETDKDPLCTHDCDGCECTLTLQFHFCTKCNYDLCNNCFKTKSPHHHEMFEFNEHWAIDTYENPHIIKTIE